MVCGACCYGDGGDGGDGGLEHARYLYGVWMVYGA